MKTVFDGRFVSDAIVAIQGGSGVQSFQMCLAALLQALNGILLARLLQLSKRSDVFLVASTLCLCPYFLDYYAFSIDILAFCLGDSFAIFGAMLLASSVKTIWRVLGTGFLYWLSVSTYQPKIALVGLLTLCVLLLKTRRGALGCDERAFQKEMYRTLALAITAVFLAIAGYWIVFKLTAHPSGGGMRTTLNSPQQMALEVTNAYAGVPRHLACGIPGLPDSVRVLLCAAIAVGISRFILDAWAHSRFALLIALICLGLLPVALCASYILNSNSWRDAGRLMAPHAYCISFFLGAALGLKWFRPFALAICATVTWLFAVAAAQQSQAVAFKTLFETQLLNRIVSRAEQLLEPAMESPTGIVVIGALPYFPMEKYMRYPFPHAVANTAYSSFAVFRQVEFVNFFCGSSAFRHPTKDEVDAAIESASASGRHPWPSPDSVYIHEGAIVILLSPYKPGIDVTWAR
jgi:hypothetical protein